MAWAAFVRGVGEDRRALVEGRVLGQHEALVPGREWSLRPYRLARLSRVDGEGLGRVVEMPGFIGADLPTRKGLQHRE